jgi:pyridoxine 5-phosphate synthase
MRAPRQRLYVNVDHVATIRQARRASEPDPVEAALLCEAAGADGITAHLREDRRHIVDTDVERLRRQIRTVFNFEMARTPEMLDIAERIRPHQVTLVPERREELTTEGGLDVGRAPRDLARDVARLRAASIRVSLFIDADTESVRRSREAGADAIEFHTGRYAHHADDPSVLAAIHDAATLAASLGLHVHAGHGLTVRNVGRIAAVPEIEELNIGHSIVSRAVLIGMEGAVREMLGAMKAARGVSQTEKLSSQSPPVR